MQLPTQDLSQHVIIIGAGIVGVNLADELVSCGWSNLTVIEQGPLQMPGGSTSHAPGLVFQTNASKTMSQLAKYTVDKLSTLEQDGENCFHHRGGLEVATTTARLNDLKRKHGWASSWGIPGRLVSPDECLKLYPLLSRDRVLGGLHIPSDGLAKARRAVQLLIDRTMRAGVRYLESTPVVGIERHAQRITAVRTPDMTLTADIVVSCAGFWGVEIGKMVDVPIPLVPLAHQYVMTDSVPALAARQAMPNGADMPILRHQDEDLYFREHGDRYGIGYYGHRPMSVDAAALGSTPPQVDEYNQPSRLAFTRPDFAPAWEESQKLLPSIRQSNIGDGFNGIFSFTPDGGPLVGQASGLDGFWVAEAVWVTHSAGVARAVAQMLTTGCSDVDMTECLLSRFDKAQLTPEYVSETSQQNFNEVYDIIHPWQPRSSPRGLRLSPFHARQKALGAFFVDVKAWERPEWYEANAALIETMPRKWQPIKRDDWSSLIYSPAAAAEAWKTRTAVAMYDLTSVTRLVVSGPGAVDLLQRLCTRDVSKEPGTSVYALFLSSSGRIRGDASIAKLRHDFFQLSVSSNVDTEYLAREARYQSRRLPLKWVKVQDISDSTCCIGLWGPLSLSVIGRISTKDIGTNSPSGMQCKSTTLAGIPVTAVRSSEVGEDGWELTTTADHGPRLWDVFWQAGQSYGIVAAGRLALVALRLEKGRRVFGSDFTPEHDPFQAGVEHGLDLRKHDFVGLQAVRNLSDQNLTRKLQWLSIDDGSSVVMGKEPVFQRGEVVGYVANAAFGYGIRRPVAHAWLAADVCEGDAVSIEYFGKMISATVSSPKCEYRDQEAPFSARL